MGWVHRDVRLATPGNVLNIINLPNGKVVPTLTASATAIMKNDGSFPTPLLKVTLMLLVNGTFLRKIDSDPFQLAPGEKRSIQQVIGTQGGDSAAGVVIAQADLIDVQTGAVLASAHSPRFQGDGGTPLGAMLPPPPPQPMKPYIVRFAPVGGSGGPEGYLQGTVISDANNEWWSAGTQNAFGLAFWFDEGSYSSIDQYARVHDWYT